MKIIGFWKLPATVAAFCLVLVGCADADNVGDDANVSVRAYQVSAGISHTVAIGMDGTLWAWGNNENGQLGDDTIISHRSDPVQIGTYDDWAYVSAGGNHTAAIRTDGTLWAWGLNNDGQLGDGSMGIASYRNAPAQIGTDANWVTVSAGGNHTLGIRTDGSLWAWGDNGNGQLGIGAAGGSLPIPMQVQPGTEWASVSAGRGHAFTLGIQADGSLWAWGNNHFGQLGDGTVMQRNAPVRVGTSNDWVSVSTGCCFTVGIREGGSLWAWGDNGNGQVGDGTTTIRRIPVQVLVGTTWVSASADLHHTVAIMENGTLWAWGANWNGQLGDGTTTDRHAPVRVRTLTDANWASASAGWGHIVIAETDGALWAWGANSQGQLGDGTTIDRHIQVQVTP